MILRKLGLVAAMGAAVAVGYVLRRPGRPMDSAPSVAPSLASDVAALRSEVSGLERLLATNAQRLALVEGAAEKGHEAAAAGNGHLVLKGPLGAQSPSPPTPEQRKVRQERLLRAMDEAAQHEPRDRSWAPSYEGQVRDAIQAATAGGAASNIESLSCRTSVCRVELSHPTSDAQARFMDELRAHLPPVAALHVTPSQGVDGASRTVVDLVRQGYPIPGSEESAD